MKAVQVILNPHMPPVALGAPMRGLICGTAVKSASDSVAEGAVVMGVGTWSDYACVQAAMISPVPEIKGIPHKDVFGQLYLLGPTAYFGLIDIWRAENRRDPGRLRAADAVGSIAGQLGKALGCKTVGIAGKEKCAALIRDFGFDQVIDYKGARTSSSVYAKFAPKASIFILTMSAVRC